MTSFTSHPARSVSKIDSKKTSVFKISKTFGASSTYGVYVPELRCVKHSDRITSRKCEATIETHEFEKSAWQQTFDVMGKLKQLHLKEYTPYTTLNKAPYHCCSLARSYNVSYGKISHAEGGTVKGIVKPVKEIKLSSFCRCTEPIVSTRKGKTWAKSVVGRVLSRNTVDLHQRLLNYGVLVWWDSEMYSGETICEWLQRFGHFVFSFYKAKSTLVVFFDQMKSAHRAVNCPLVNTGIHITWNDVRLYNNGFYRIHENDCITKDGSIRKIVSRKIKAVSMDESQIRKKLQITKPSSMGMTSIY